MITFQGGTRRYHDKSIRGFLQFPISWPRVHSQVSKSPFLGAHNCQTNESVQTVTNNDTNCTVCQETEKNDLPIHHCRLSSVSHVPLHSTKCGIKSKRRAQHLCRIQKSPSRPIYLITFEFLASLCTHWAYDATHCNYIRRSRHTTPAYLGRQRVSENWWEA